METEFDVGNIYVTVDIEYKLWPAEPKVMYDSDGSGSPGCPAEIELLDVDVTSCSGETYDKDYAQLCKTGWFKDLNRLAREYIEEDIHTRGWLSEHISESEGERELGDY